MNGTWNGEREKNNTSGRVWAFLQFSKSGTSFPWWSPFCTNRLACSATALAPDGGHHWHHCVQGNILLHRCPKVECMDRLNCTRHSPHSLHSLTSARPSPPNTHPAIHHTACLPVLPCPALPCLDSMEQKNRSSQPRQHNTPTPPPLAYLTPPRHGRKTDTHTLILLTSDGFFFCHCTTTQRQYGSTPLSLPVHWTPGHHRRVPLVATLNVSRAAQRCYSPAAVPSQQRRPALLVCPGFHLVDGGSLLAVVHGGLAGWLVVVGSFSPDKHTHDIHYLTYLYPINSHSSPIPIPIPHHPLQFTVVAFGLLCLALLRIVVACLGLESVRSWAVPRPMNQSLNQAGLTDQGQLSGKSPPGLFFFFFFFFFLFWVFRHSSFFAQANPRSQSVSQSVSQSINR
ncbi:hypothetical protein QR685DRAFT_153167 [Neurospora intermedia]|uniref:Uncharacterized protein n=1 Tax=Neurospora intermedia TaxID=5142 RepID=A0ABR3DJ70_NEUIN